MLVVELFARARLSRRNILLTLASTALVALTPVGANAVELAGVRQDGKEIAPGEITGWRLVYFGYTQCPDICPISLHSMTEAINALGPIGERITPVFVSVDPERDTPEVMAKYLAFFHPRMVGLSPHPDQLADLARAWRIKFSRVALKDGGYTVDHTATIFFTDPSGTIIGRYPHDLDGEALANRIRATLMAQ